MEKTRNVINDEKAYGAKLLALVINWINIGNENVKFLLHALHGIIGYMIIRVN